MTPQSHTSGRRVRAAALATAMALLVTACGDDDTGETSTITSPITSPTPEVTPAPVVTDNVAATMPAGTGTVEISMVDISFDQPDITVPAGTTVVWTNDDSVDHTATSGDGTFESGVLAPGESFEFTFDIPGTYSYVCEIHPQMQGTVTVEG